MSDYEENNLFRLPPVELLGEYPDKDSLQATVAERREFMGWAKSMTRISEVWRETRGRNVKVAVLDTGVNLTHDDLQDGAIADSIDFTGVGVEDKNGHGTHCAGIIAARKNNHGVIGVAPECSLLVAKVLDNRGSGTYESIAEGINWAVKNDADVISMSLGGAGTNNYLFEAVHAALAKGVTIICAAGNSGSWYRNNIGYPGRYGGVITVAAHDFNANRSGFSSRGGEIDFMAPGERITSTYRNNGYAELSGTSMATPFIAGLAALLKSHHKNTNVVHHSPLENVEDMRNHLMTMAAHPGYHDNTTGYGPLQPLMYF